MKTWRRDRRCECQKELNETSELKIHRPICEDIAL